MGIFSGNQPYDRVRILQAAARAQQKKRRRKAIALYRQVLAVEPGNAELHAQLATLLAQKKECFDAWMSYRRASQALLQEGSVQDALTALREAVRLLPGEFDAWVQLGRVERKEGQARHAQQTLLRGAQQFRRDRPRAIYLLRRAREIAAWDVRTVTWLARLLAKTRQRDEALLLLDQLSSRVQGVELRRVRGVQWRILPSLAHTWLWLRAAMDDGSRATAAASRR